MLTGDDNWLFGFGDVTCAARQVVREAEQKQQHTQHQDDEPDCERGQPVATSTPTNIHNQSRFLSCDDRARVASTGQVQRLASASQPT